MAVLPVRKLIKGSAEIDPPAIPPALAAYSTQLLLLIFFPQECTLLVLPIIPAETVSVIVTSNYNLIQLVHDRFHFTKVLFQNLQMSNNSLLYCTAENSKVSPATPSISK
jgi:hypothetical protein